MQKFKHVNYGFGYRKGIISLVLFFPLLTHAQQKDSISSEHNLQEVQITEKRRPAVTQSATLLQVIDKSFIDRLGIQDLSSAVRHFSGVAVKDYGGVGGLKTVSIRGLGAQHTAVSYDGVAVSDCQSGEVDLSRFSLDNVSSVTLSIGQSDNIFQNARTYASAGALSIESNTPQFTTRNYDGQVQVRGGSFGLFNPSFRYNQKLNNRLVASLNAEWTSAKGEYPFVLENGTLITKEKRKNTDVQSLRIEGNVYSNLRNGGTLKGKLYFFDSERGLPGNVTYYNNYSKQRLWDKIFFAQANYEKKLDDQLKIRLQAKYNYAYNRFTDPAQKMDNKIQDDRYTQQEYYGTAGLLYTPIEELSFTFAEDIFYNTLDNTFDDCPYPKRITSLSVLAARFQNSRFTAIASLLGTYLTEKVTVGERVPDRKKLSPAVSVSYRLLAETNIRIRASYKDIFRVPTFNDLYYTQIGNRSLRPESTEQYNVGISWSGAVGKTVKYLSLSVDAYYNEVKDKIVALPSLFIWKMMNMGKVEAKGIDVNLSSELVVLPQVSLFLAATYSYQQAIDLTDKEAKNYKNQIPYAPLHAGSGSVSIENPWVNVAYSFIASGKRYALPQNIEDNLIKRYVEHTISLNKSFRIKKAQLRVQADVVNLGNKTYDIIQFYPMPGRSFRGIISYIF